MSYDDLITGAVLRYPYLWVREADRGETAGRKERPVVIAVRVRRPGRSDWLALFPITTKAPERGQNAVEIPETEKRHAGIDAALRQWVMLDEFNAEILLGCYHLEPDVRIGRLNRPFFEPLARRIIARIHSVSRVQRFD